MAPSGVGPCDRARGATAKQLDIVWDDGLILHTNLLLGGPGTCIAPASDGGSRRRSCGPASPSRAFSAVCFNARTVETYREFDTHRHPGFGSPGPDLSVPHPDLGAAVEALCRYADLDAPIAEALLDQHVAWGVGNVFRSEILWASRQHPFAPVSMLNRSDMERILAAAGKVLHVISTSRHRRRSTRRPGRLRPQWAALSSGAVTRSRFGASGSMPACCTGARAARCTAGRGHRRRHRRTLHGSAPRRHEVPRRTTVAPP